MSEPKRIYLQPECCMSPQYGRMWCEDRMNECEENAPDVEYVRADLHEALRQRVAELEAAVRALPVAEWVKQGEDGHPVLLGYTMQAQGEWDRVLQALSREDDSDD